MQLPSSPLPLAAANAQHRGRRENQEDSFGFSSFSDAGFISHSGYVSVIADGMGGLEHGSQASSTAIRAFLAAYRQKTPGESVLDALQRSARTANDEVFRLAQDLGSVDQTGATLVAAAIFGNRLDWIGVGDSRLYVCSKERFRQVTEDHNFRVVLSEQVKQGVLTDGEADAHPKANALTSYLGREQIPFLCSSSAGSITLKKGDWVVLCSDGLSGTLSDPEIAKELHGTAHEASERLLLRALSKDLQHQDNITAIVLHCAAEGVPLPVENHSSAKKTAALTALAAVALSAASLATYLFVAPVPDPLTGSVATPIIPIVPIAAENPNTHIPGVAEPLATPPTDVSKPAPEGSDKSTTDSTVKPAPDDAVKPAPKVVKRAVSGGSAKPVPSAAKKPVASVSVKPQPGSQGKPVPRVEAKPLPDGAATQPNGEMTTPAPEASEVPSSAVPDPTPAKNEPIP